MGSRRSPSHTGFSLLRPQKCPDRVVGVLERYVERLTEQRDEGHPPLSAGRRDADHDQRNGPELGGGVGRVVGGDREATSGRAPGAAIVPEKRESPPVSPPALYRAPRPALAP